MTKNSIFLFLCIYNLEVLTYNQMKPLIEKSCYFSVISKLCTAAINQTGKCKGMGRDGSDVIQSTQTQINMTPSIRNVTSKRLIGENMERRSCNVQRN